MDNDQVNLDQFDSWLNDDSEFAALVVRQWLEPVEGKESIIFPPTYAKPERTRNEDWLGYNIDRFDDGSSVCQIDSVGSQANRMEPIFKRERYRGLVPQITIKAGEREINLLDAGHRAADAIVRFSNLESDLEEAFKQLNAGNAGPMAKLAPTSLVFGAWDSRGTQVKMPRIVRSVIRAFNARTLHRSAQYIPAVDYVKEKLIDEPIKNPDRDRISEEGLSYVPASWTPGGVQVLGDIRRDASLNLSALRTLADETPGNTLGLRRYILGLALVSFMAPQETFLREGCQLTLDHERPTEWQLIRYDGVRDPFVLTHADALMYACEAANGFEIGPDKIAEFDSKKCKEALKKSKDELKKSRSTSTPITEEQVG